MIGRRCLQAVIGILLLTAISACSVPLDVIFRNSSGADIVVVRKGDSHETLEIAVKSEEEKEIRSLLTARFSIAKGSTFASYAGNEVDESFVAYSGVWPFNKRKVKARLDVDGCIYLLAVDADMSKAKAVAQPPRFPLCPDPLR